MLGMLLFCVSQHLTYNPPSSATCLHWTCSTPPSPIGVTISFAYVGGKQMGSTFPAIYLAICHDPLPSLLTVAASSTSHTSTYSLTLVPYSSTPSLLQGFCK